MTRPPARACQAALAAAVALVCSALAVPGVRADDPLYYFVEGQGVVITNTPSRSDAQPVTKPAARPERSAPARRKSGPSARPAAMPATRYDDFIDRVAAEAGLPPNLIKAVVWTESNFDTRAVSSKGAQGLMQLMPATARAYGVTDAFDPRQNLRAGARHLRVLMEEFNGDLTLALAAYNAGSTAVRRHGGVPNYPETRDYVRKVRARLGHEGSEKAAGPPPLPPAAPVRLVTGPDGAITLKN